MKDSDPHPPASPRDYGFSYGCWTGCLPGVVLVGLGGFVLLRFPVPLVHRQPFRPGPPLWAMASLVLIYLLAMGYAWAASRRESFPRSFRQGLGIGMALSLGVLLLNPWSLCLFEQMCR